jgi:hypothetical protein
MPPSDPFTALVVPVPAADWLLAGRVADAHSRAAGLDVPAHVSLLVPFAPREEVSDGVLAELGDLFADVVPFSFRLETVSQFPDGPVYLAPDPSAPFRRITQQLGRRFPEYPHEENRFDDVVPHLTVPLRAGESLADVERLVAARGRVSAQAQEAALLAVSGAGLETLAVFPFGTTAA